MNLKYIFEAIIPENIKDIPLMRVAMDIFLDNIKKNSSISIDINKIYQILLNGNDTLSETSKVNLKNALLDTYLSELFNTIKNTQNTKEVQDKLSLLGITDSPINSNANLVLGSEYLTTNKSFKENVGTEASMKYAHELTKYLEGSADDLQLELTPVKPFHMRINGSIISELYSNIVSHLSHPIGFVYEYSQLINETLIDLFGLIASYDVTNIEVRELNGTFDVFTEDSDDTNVKADFISRGYTSEEYDAMILDGTIIVHLNKIVSSIIETNVNDGLIKTVTFTDGTVLTHTPDPITVTYQDSLGTDLKIFSGHYSLYTNYTIIYTVDYVDDVSFVTNFNTNIIDNDLFDVTDSGNVTDNFLMTISTTGSYLTTSDNYYLVSDDALDPTNQFYPTAI